MDSETFELTRRELSAIHYHLKYSPRDFMAHLFQFAYLGIKF